MSAPKRKSSKAKAKPKPKSKQRKPASKPKARPTPKPKPKPGKKAPASTPKKSATRTEAPTQVQPVANGNGMPPTQSTFDWRPFAAVVVAFVLVCAALTAAIVIAKNATDDSGSNGSAAGGNTAEEQSALEEVQDTYEKYTYQDFKMLAATPEECARNGRFIDEKLVGNSPAAKAEVIFRCTARDKVTLAGLEQTINPGAYNPQELLRLLTANLDSQVRWRAWHNGIRDRLTGSADIRNIPLNGSGFTTYVTAGGAVGSQRDSWNGDPGTAMDLAAASVNGKNMPAQTMKFEEICNNRIFPGGKGKKPPPKFPPHPPDLKDVRSLDNSVTGEDLHDSTGDTFQQADNGTVSGTSGGGDQGQDNGSGPGNGPAHGTVTDTDGNKVGNDTCQSGCAEGDHTDQGAIGDPGPPGPG